jgi:hypothetical protein
MSVVVTAVAPFDADMYDRVTERVMPDGKLPQGCELHIAGPVDQGWRVITVWDSADTFDQFRQEKLLPAIAEVTGGEAPQAIQPEVNEVHNLVTA